jgi:hypothetical protein
MARRKAVFGSGAFLWELAMPGRRLSFGLGLDFLRKLPWKLRKIRRAALLRVGGPKIGCLRRGQNMQSGPLDCDFGNGAPSGAQRA